MTGSQIRQINDVFKSLDVDGNGSLSKPELADGNNFINAQILIPPCQALNESDFLLMKLPKLFMPSMSTLQVTHKSGGRELKCNS